MSFFFLKINEDAFYTMPCLQKWLNIVESSGCKFKIICDNTLLSQKILQKNIYCKGKTLTKEDIICSDKETLVPLLEPYLSHNWIPAGAAHLTTLTYAKSHNLKTFWNIDADDTSFLSNPEIIWKKMRLIEDYAENNDISCISLDMWNTLSGNAHWSFGITFIRNNIDYFDFIKDKQNIPWKEKYPHLPNNLYNLDWFFTYLRDYKHLSLKIFYFESEFFIHWKMKAGNAYYNNVHYWKNNIMFTPSFTHLIGGNKYHHIPYESIYINNTCVEQSNKRHSRLVLAFQILRCEVMSMLFPSKRPHYIAKSMKYNTILSRA